MLTFFRTTNHPLAHLSAEVDRIVKDLAAPADGWSGYGLRPPADVVETEAAFVVRLDLPGHDAKAIQIQVENDVLTVQSERKIAQVEGETAHRSERSAGTYLRSFALPKSVDGGRVEATYQDGVLAVTLPKRDDARPRTIAVQVK
jgi:HSP20 family protein